ncbi:MAG: hypothetical protein IJQ80_04960, partial [Clostridia bacterium]|nr:hypothetical protein [Clostridia bacterium]
MRSFLKRIRWSVPLALILAALCFIIYRVGKDSVDINGILSFTVSSPSGDAQTVFARNDDDA